MDREKIIKDGLFLLELISKLDCTCKDNTKPDCPVCITDTTLTVITQVIGKGMLEVRREHPELYDQFKDVTLSLETVH